MKEDEFTGPSPTLEVSTWFQVHRDRDEHCCKMALATEQELLVVRAGELERGRNELNPMFEEGG